MTRRTARAGLDRERVRRRRRTKEQLKLRDLADRDAEVGKPNQREPRSPPGAIGIADSAVGRRPDATATGRRSGSQQVPCGWCGTLVELKARGPIPKWCSSTCRHRAWEQARAARSGLVAQVVVNHPVLVLPSSTDDWLDHLSALAKQMRRPGLELASLRDALEAVLLEIDEEERQRSADGCW